MKKATSLVLIIISTTVVLLLSSYRKPFFQNELRMPWKSAGLTERQAAAHLLSRFTFGSRPGDVDKVIKMGLENWFNGQLEGKLDDAFLNKTLGGYNLLNISNQQVLDSFYNHPNLVKKAVAEGYLNKDSVEKQNKNLFRERVAEFAKNKGYHDLQELYSQFVSYKILAAAYSENQLHQVLTEFWFNHFNVSMNKVGKFVPAYERDAIRPNVVGKFENIVLATAQSPAMLFYLDNATSSGVNEEFEKANPKLKKPKLKNGLNENYAREVMELHTLGVDGGYTQADVTEAARILTGWTVYPMNGLKTANFGRAAIVDVEKDDFNKLGFFHKGDFLFAVNRHDNGSKKVLGKSFPAGGGYQEGLDLIHLLSHHPSTAKFISKKLAIRFVSDSPPQSLIDKMAATFLKTDADIKQVLITMVSAPEFWNVEAVRNKIKSPFELTISTIRALNVKVDQPALLYQWIAKMGQQMYYYLAPTGFSDKAQTWINTGGLLNRMKFGLAFASQKIPGIKLDLLALNQNHEPAGPIEGLRSFSKIMMPERDVESTIKRLELLVNDPTLMQKVESAAANKPVEQIITNSEVSSTAKNTDKKLASQSSKNNDGIDMEVPKATGTDYPLAQIVGIIISSPEFQRR